MTFANDFVFTRGTGKTRVNRAGLIVGVDFSASSVTFGLGTQTFVLAADANVNRDWAVGSKVIAVSQAAPLGSMEGTVTSYTPSTQTLVLNVTVSTGTGLATNWRIGSLEITRDVLSGGVESHVAATNLALFSEDLGNAYWTKVTSTIQSNVAISPNGSMNADSVLTDVGSTSGGRIRRQFSITAGQNVTFSAYVKPVPGAVLPRVSLLFNGVIFGNNTNDVFDLTLGTIVTNASGSARIDPAPNGFFRISQSRTAASTASADFELNNQSNGNLGDGLSGILVWGLQVETNGNPTPYIPTTTAQISRTADSFALSASALARLTSQGTIYAEVESADIGPAQKRAMRLSGDTGSIRLAKRGVGNFSGFTEQLEVDDVLYFGTTAGNSQRDNGREILPFQATVNERTGQPETVGNLSALAYDGSTQIAYAGGNTEERFLTKDLALWSGKGFGGIPVNGGHWNGNRFLFASNTTGIVFVSTDGLSWRRVNTPVISQVGREITSGLVGETLRNVLVGDNGFIVTSDDNGETWTTRTSGVTQAINGVTFGLSLFVACRTNAASQNILTSPDGVTWTIRATADVGTLVDVAFNGTNLFVAVGNAGNITTSPDGITWTSRTSGTTQNLVGVHFANSTWVAVGGNGTVVTSPDGITWTVQSSGTTDTLNEVTYFNNLFVAVGNAGRIITSPNGVTWTTRTSYTNNSQIGTASNNSILVTAGLGGSLGTSPDGLTYTSRTNNNVTINGMAYGNGVFVSVGNAQNNSGYIATIDAAGVYTRRVSGFNQNLLSVRFLNGAFYANFGNSAGVPAIIRSVDGITWAAAGTLTNNINYDTAFGNGVFVACRASSQVIVSADGISFNTTTNTGLTPATNLLSIAFANGLFVVVGAQGVIGTSTNGTTWTQRTSGTTQNLTSVIYSTRDQLWYAAGANGTLLISADAITWQPVQNAALGAVSNTTLQATLTMAQFRAGRNRMAISYKDNQVITSLNGVSKSDFTAVIPAITAGAMGENLNGYIKDMKIYPDALTEAELNALTGV